MDSTQSSMEEEAVCNFKRKPPPIPKRNPNTRLSVGGVGSTSTPGLNRSFGIKNLSRSFDFDSVAGEGATSTTNSARANRGQLQRQYSSTLPRRASSHSHRLDICTELLNYISELTQELMAETSFTEAALSDEMANGELSPRGPAPGTIRAISQSSVAIQTDIDDIQRETQQGTGTATDEEELPDNDRQALKMMAEAVDRSNSPRAKPSFRDIRKMLKEGSIEGIADEPPIFKPPPPPGQLPGVTVTPVKMAPVGGTGHQPTLQRESRRTGPKVQKCLSTFEPSSATPSPATSVSITESPAKNRNLFVSPTRPATVSCPPLATGASTVVMYSKIGSKPLILKPKPALSTEGQRIQDVDFSSNISTTSSAYANKVKNNEFNSRIQPMTTGQPTTAKSEARSIGKATSGGSETQWSSAAKRIRQAATNTSTLGSNTLAMPIERYITESSKLTDPSNNGGGVTRTPPPPPLNKNPPPKIVVELPAVKKHRQSSSCGTTCSCLCLKRQSPYSSPIPSSASLPMTSQVTHSQHPRQRSPSRAECKSELKSLYSPDGSMVRQDAYDALIAEIRAAIKRRQSSVDNE